MDDNVKIQWKVKFFYGLGDLSANILLAIFSFYLLFFMVSMALTAAISRQSLPASMSTMDIGISGTSSITAAEPTACM